MPISKKIIIVHIWQDMKDPRRRDEMAAARADLKKHSTMLFTASKVSTNI